MIYYMPFLRYFFSQTGQKRHFFKITQQPKSTTPIFYPNQYPVNLKDKSPLIPRGRPVRLMTSKSELPQDKLMSDQDVVLTNIYKDKWQSPPNAYRLNIGLIGPVNSGKSQLIAKLSHKVSAVSPKSHTTDQILETYKSLQVQREGEIRNIQLKYFDSPGLMHNKTGYISKGWKVLADIDFSLVVVDSSKKFDDLMQQSINRLEKHRNYQNFMKALVLNKVDLVQNKRKFHGLITQIQKYGKFDKIFYTSALTGYGVKQIQEYLLGMAKPGQWACPKQVKTGSSYLQIVQQLMRQTLFHRTYFQVPYTTVVQCQSIATKSDKTDVIEFRLHVQDENIQRMIIGIKGRNINWMRDRFKVQYAKIYGKEVQVHVRVVIRKSVYKKDMQQMESSYFKQQTNQDMSIVKDHLMKKGKFLG